LGLSTVGLRGRHRSTSYPDDVTTMTPTAARAFWLALVDNAARILSEADSLCPSPRAQSLVVLAQEEVGKAVWVSEAFSSAWDDGDETPLEVTELRKQGRHHIAKLMKATDFHTAMIEVPGNPKPVEVELVREHAPELLVAYSTGFAHEDNLAKQKGFYVDLEEDGSFTVPHEIDRPYLRRQIWWAADMVKWLLDEDHLLASVTGRAVPSTDEVEARLGVILARDLDG
jgi:AbiV family abortive infection protein